jgi:hypothetical protein
MKYIFFNLAVWVPLTFRIHLDSSVLPPVMESAQGEGRASSMDGGGDASVQLQGPDSAAAGAPDGGDWRAQLPPEIRKRVVIMLYVTSPLPLPPFSPNVLFSFF